MSECPVRTIDWLKFGKAEGRTRGEASCLAGTANGRKAMKTMPCSIVIFITNIAVRTSTISLIGEASRKSTWRGGASTTINVRVTFEAVKVSNIHKKYYG